MTLHDLSYYGLSADRGFLSQHEIDEVALPAAFVEVEAAAALLPDLITTGRVRYWLDKVPTADIREFLRHAGAAELTVAMVRYCFLAQAYLRGEAAPASGLPANLAGPLAALAGALGVPPGLSYAGYVLGNWRRIDKAGPIVFENIAMPQRLIGGPDEAGFALTHVAIEAAAGPALDLAVDLVRTSDAGEAWAVETMLHEMAAVWRSIGGIADRLAERCDPAFYGRRIRPSLDGGAGEDGAIGRQSSILPAMEALFGIALDRDSPGPIHRFRPPAHRAFIEDLAAASTLPAFVERQGGSLAEAFAAAIETIAAFRMIRSGQQDEKAPPV
jgi:indoleamine 2,3-dioxygenase